LIIKVNLFPISTLTFDIEDGVVGIPSIKVSYLCPFTVSSTNQWMVNGI
jgi:hypothetical protein